MNFSEQNTELALLLVPSGGTSSGSRAPAPSNPAPTNFPPSSSAPAIPAVSASVGKKEIQFFFF